MKYSLIPIAMIAFSAPAFAQEHHGSKHDNHHNEAHSDRDDSHDNHDMHDDHDHSDHAHEGHEAHTDETHAEHTALVHSPDITAALAKGGDAAVVNVLGVVCDFCAKAMNKTFGKKDEVAAVYVDLDTKTLNLVFAPDQSLSDDTIEKLVKKAGYRTSSITRIASSANASE